MKKKKILDASNTETEFKAIEKEIYLIKQRFVAVALDYKSYIDSSFKNSDIFGYRDNVIYRLNAAKFHLQLLFNHIEYSQSNIQANVNSNIPAAMVSGSFAMEISSLLDSFIFHSVTVFDYISSLTNYISGLSNKKSLMWTQLAKSVRDKNNGLSKMKFSKTIDDINREFVCKLYDYRSILIHRESDISGHSVSHDLMSGKVTTVFYAGEQIIKNFKTLKELNQEHDLTIKYVALWIIKEGIKKINEILFSLKAELESRYDGKELMMFFLHPETNEKLPTSINFWYEELYKK